MRKILEKIALCIDRGKADHQSPYPPDLAGKEGAAEWTKKALKSGIHPQQVLAGGLISGMQKVGEKFRDGEIYLPDVLMAAKAMNASMEFLKPHFLAGDLQYKGRIVMGTVAGDLHDIGKKIVAMIFEGGGWQVVDCGVDVSPEKFLEAIEEHRPQAVGLSALLTTTMVSMEKATREIKVLHPEVRVIVGGAPVTKDFAERIGADFYSPDPQGALEYLNKGSGLAF